MHPHFTGSAPSRLHRDGADAHIGGVDSPAQPWVIVERGSFVFAKCEACGWLSSARRAYASAEKEGMKHMEACPGALTPDAGDGS